MPRRAIYIRHLLSTTVISKCFAMIITVHFTCDHCLLLRPQILNGVLNDFLSRIRPLYVSHINLKSFAELNLNSWSAITGYNANAPPIYRYENSFCICSHLSLHAPHAEAVSTIFVIREIKTKNAIISHMKNLLIKFKSRNMFILHLALEFELRFGWVPASLPTKRAEIENCFASASECV